MTDIGTYSYDEFVNMVESFHGHLAPGLVIGGFMVDKALKNLPEGEFFDAICETRACLPDAIQLLTPCTIGNGWLKVMNMGRYALTLYEKFGGEGIRIFVDPDKLGKWPEVNSWFFKLKPKKEQDFQLLMDQIKAAGADYCSLQQVNIKPEFIRQKGRGGFAVCAVCNESYPKKHGGICRGCQGEAPYIDQVLAEGDASQDTHLLKSVPVEDAVGQHALHDMTRIIPGKEKGPLFKKDQKLSAGDVCRLQQMGRENIYTVEENPDKPGWVHEDVAALAFGKAMAGKGIKYTEKPKEGKSDLIAETRGLLAVDKEMLETFNLIPDVMCASRHHHSVVDEGFKLAGTRAIPLYLAESNFQKAMQVLKSGPLLNILPMRKAKVGILVTGTELFRGLVEDKFKPIIKNKVEKYQCTMVHDLIVPDDENAICNGVNEILDKGADLIITTAGLSVDPDDVTRKGLVDAGAVDLIYGLPVLPGAMTLLARIRNAQIVGVPACALYHKTTSFDLLLPRLLAGVSMKRQDLAKLGNGGFCLNCKTCTFPKCTFGKQ